ncbi:MAG TPA: hypothetical protein VHI55_09575 [Gaiellaceae bacterium]|nr:hypothetical protein [Gaiellaceae bacterium]
MHRLAVPLAAILTSALLVPAALADKPAREPLPAPPFFLATDSCSFDVRIDILVNKEFLTTFTSGKTLITGRLVARVTNLDDPSKSRVLNISGPGKNDLADPSTFNLSGSSLIFFPGVMVLAHGPVSLTFDADGNVTSFTQTSASSVDLCALLAGP